MIPRTARATDGGDPPHKNSAAIQRNGAAFVLKNLAKHVSLQARRHERYPNIQSEFRLGSAIFGISDVDFLRIVRIKRVIEQIMDFR